MEEAGLIEVETYVSHLQNTDAQLIATIPMMELCLVAERRPGSWVANQWWGQEVLYLKGMRTEAREAEQEEGGWGGVGWGGGTDRDTDG